VSETVQAAGRSARRRSRASRRGGRRSRGHPANVAAAAGVRQHFGRAAAGQALSYGTFRLGIDWMCYSVDTMSNTVGIRELRQQTSRVLKRVVAGEVVEVTDHGHPIARIVPLRPSVLDQLTTEGRATEAAADLLDILDDLSLPAAPAGHMLPSAALAELRAEE
jgi:prevent-host-death family protein